MTRDALKKSLERCHVGSSLTPTCAGERHDASRRERRFHSGVESHHGPHAQACLVHGGCKIFERYLSLPAWRINRNAIGVAQNEGVAQRAKVTSRKLRQATQGGGGMSEDCERATMVEPSRSSQRHQRCFTPWRCSIVHRLKHVATPNCGGFTRDCCDLRSRQ